ncbi:MAG: segregation/condensation protein A [Candidatus Aminicenantes bacterium]|nr:segregation/condensation protein A [Candidatus Aminicenantes bacterium]
MEAGDLQESYQVRLEIFEGPLDLLLFLIKKRKLNIHDIPIAVITRDYLEYLARKQNINLNREAEFLLMAAFLIFLKSQMLLPREQLQLNEESDPRRILVDQLLEYQKMKITSSLLRKKEEEQQRRWLRPFVPVPLSLEEEEILEVNLFDLAECFYLLMKQKEDENFKVLKGREVSLEKKMKEILDLLEKQPVLDFLEYLKQQESLEEALVAFFCLLEMVRARLVIAFQESLFQTIKVWLRRERIAEGLG